MTEHISTLCIENKYHVTRAEVAPARYSGDTEFMKILVLGATGGTGKHLVEQALRAGHEVSALVRDPMKITIRDPKLTVTKGDVTAAEDLEKALADIEVVIGALGPRNKTDPVCATAASATVKAMEKRCVKRLCGSRHRAWAIAAQR